MRSGFNIGSSVVPLGIPIKAIISGTNLSPLSTWPQYITGVYEYHAIGGGGGGRSGNLASGTIIHGEAGEAGEYITWTEARSWQYGATPRPYGGIGGVYSAGFNVGTDGDFTGPVSHRADGGLGGTDAVAIPNQLAAASPFPFGVDIGKGGNGGLSSTSAPSIEDGEDGQEGAIYSIKRA